MRFAFKKKQQHTTTSDINFKTLASNINQTTAVLSFACQFSLALVWVALSRFHIQGLDFSPESPGGRAMRRELRREPEWTEVLASPVRAELCTIIVSFLYDQHSPVRDLPVDIIYLSWSSNRIFSFTLRFREITTPSVADHGESDDNR
jgi:hypothetical protein